MDISYSISCLHKNMFIYNFYFFNKFENDPGITIILPEKKIFKCSIKINQPIIYLNFLIFYHN